jgi:hypothetical protein
MALVTNYDLFQDLYNYIKSGASEKVVEKQTNNKFKLL